MNKYKLSIDIINIIISFYINIKCKFISNHNYIEYKIKRFYYTLKYPEKKYDTIVCCKCLMREYYIQINTNNLLHENRFDKSCHFYNNTNGDIFYKRSRYIKKKQLNKILLRIL